MKQNHQQYYLKVQDLVITYLAPVLVNKLKAQELLIKQIKQDLSEYDAHMAQEETKVEVLELVRKMKARKETLARTVNQMSIISEEIDLDQEFSEYFQQLETYANTLPESILEDQNHDRFQPFPNDKLVLKIGKLFKKWGLQLGWVPVKLANWIRKKANKPTKALKIWKHEVPLRGMISYHFRDLLVEQLIEMVQTINRAIAASTYDLYELESGLDQKFAGLVGEDTKVEISLTNIDQEGTMDQILDRIQDLSESITDITVNRLERIFKIFQANYEMVGTIELPVKTFEAPGLETAHKHARKVYYQTMFGWKNTLSVLTDRYNFDHELFHTRFTNIEQYLFFSQKLESKIQDKILGEINKISKFLDAKQQQLTAASASDQDFKKTLKEVRYETSKYLKRAIPAAIQLIRDQNIPALLEGLDTKTRNEIGQLSETRSMVKNISYEHAIKESDIDKIAPRDLITFEALPEYLLKIGALQSEVKLIMESTEQNLMEIANISDFNLETALAAIDNQSQHDKAKSMAAEGVERAHSRLQDIIDELNNFTPKANGIIRQGVDEFNSQVMALNEIDAVFDTQVRIAKAKALEKTRALRQRYIAKFREFLPMLITNLRRRGLMVYKKYRDTTQKYGIGVAAQSLTAEVAGFLSDTETTVKGLPFVYQRLFEISPLDNLFFFEPRTRAALSLRKAYENWQGGHYGATALVSEAGTGTTTLINFFLGELKSPLPIIRLGTKVQIYEEKDFFKFFIDKFEDESLADTESLIQYFNQLESKHIIVLEDLEHFFLRTVNGFDCIKIFVELLTRTNRNIFWLTSINQYCYQYLVKTSDIDDCFSYNIILMPLKPEQVTSMLLKRHRVSGFSLVFRPHKVDRKNSKFKKMDEQERQVYLQKEYFGILNQIVNGNASLALVYWLRSITDVDDDAIYIRSLKGIDTSFLGSLSEQKRFTFHAMLLHRGISVADHARVFNQDLNASKLTILALHDDGLVVHKDGRFFLNPLLFRQVVNLLKDKNILH
ncbi:MAG: hypothetical protein DHS20C17_20720 [Cyclobacteriaceae bacterium]|nr:MAG: hypothetical protein DHS20C17_20720 [Cyclobacteriaceae bacterium]